MNFNIETILANLKAHFKATYGNDLPFTFTRNREDMDCGQIYVFLKEGAPEGFRMALLIPGNVSEAVATQIAIERLEHSIIEGVLGGFHFKPTW